MVRKIIKEAMEQNPLGLKEAVAEELRNRVALALEAKMEEMSGLEEAEVGKAGPAKLVSYGPKGDKVTASKIAAHLAKRANDYSGGNAEIIKKLSIEVSKHGDATANELIGKHKAIAKNVGMDAKAAHNLISGAASALKESVDLEEAFKVGSKVKVDSEKDDDHGKSGKVVIAKNRAYVVQFADGKRGSFNEDELVNESVKLKEAITAQNKKDAESVIAYAKQNKGKGVATTAGDNSTIPNIQIVRYLESIGRVKNVKELSSGRGWSFELKESVDLEEAKMTDAEVLSAAKALAANGKDEKTKAFGKGLVDFYKKEGSFTPAQVGGLQNIMKNASFQMAKESVELDEAEAQTTYRVGGFYTHRGDDKPVSIKVSAASEAEAKQKAKDQLSGNHKNYRATTVKVV